MELLKKPNLVINNPDTIVLDLLKEKYLGKTISIYFNPNGKSHQPSIKKDKVYTRDSVAIISEVNQEGNLEYGGGYVYYFIVDTGACDFKIYL